jgi:hypothetical protein
LSPQQDQILFNGERLSLVCHGAVAEMNAGERDISDR